MPEPETKLQTDVSEHLLTLEELSLKLETRICPEKPAASLGITDDEAAERLQRFGPNMLSPPAKKHAILIYLDHLLGLFNVMLLVSGVACYVIYILDPVSSASNVYIGAILLFVAFANAYVTFYQVQKSQSVLESFMNMIPAKCYAIRDGKTVQLPAVELVRGDLVYVRSGDKIPADIAIFQSTEFKVDNSSLTGEADPQERTVRNTQQNPLEATNLAFNGTLAVNGEAYGIVIRTGDFTVIGQIASMTANEERRDSPMSQEIDHFVHIIASVAAVVALSFFLVAFMVKKTSIATAVNFAIGTFISFVPEGLPATVTFLLTFAAKKMSTRNVLVKDLQGVETLGAITLLATDKTGTLTRNQMTVTYIWTGDELFFSQCQSANEVNFARKIDTNRIGVDEILHMSVMCSRARFETDQGPIMDRKVLGDATESGLLRFAAGNLTQFDKANDRFPKVCEIPFNSTNKWNLSIHRKPHSQGSYVIYLKGAPERVLSLSTTFFDGKSVVALEQSQKARFNHTYEFMASQGHRVLAFAALALPEAQYPDGIEFSKDPTNFPLTGLTFYGLVSLEDPPKHGVREAIGYCRAAGIKVMMVTGDHPLTAEAIGRKINLMLQDTKPMIAARRKCEVDRVSENDVRAIVIHGEEIDGMTEVDWLNVFSKEEIIFARTSPKHKLQIVKYAQSLGHIVGVTGDGVNDSPALKKADLGIAMNESGSDVSKEAAAMILVDDNFASTVNGIEEGRLIFQNLKKSIQYTVTHTMPQVYANLLYIAVPLPLPLSAILIIFVDLGFEMFLSLTYALDPPESEGVLMKLQPRKPVTAQSILQLQLDDKLSYFAKMMAPSEKEVLVDSGLLCWSYLEAGTIEAVGCFSCYFFAMWWHFGVTPYDAIQYGQVWEASEYIELSNGYLLSLAEQKAAIAAGQSAFYIALLIQQAFNLFICKARMGYPIGYFMFKNVFTFVGLLFGAVLTMMVVYIQPVNVAFGTWSQLTPLVWLIAMAFGVLLLIYSMVRTAVARSMRPIKYSKPIDGLDLRPTRLSTVKG